MYIWQRYKFFSNPEFGDIRIVDVNGEPYFVGSDAARALGYVAPQNAIASHVDEDDRLLHQISAGGQKRNVTIVSESGLYSLIMSSKLEGAKKFKKWVTSEVLPSIRKTGKYEIQTAKVEIDAETRLKNQVFLVDYLRNAMRLSDVGFAQLMNPILEEHGVRQIEYVEQPQGAIHSATELLKTHGSPMSIHQFNKKMVALGYLEEKSRKKQTGKFEKYKSVTDKGLEFAKNDVSPHNDKVTQPHYYDNKFAELLQIIS